MRIKCVGIQTEIADPISNGEKILKEIELAKKENVDLLVFPKDVITGLDCGNTLNNVTLLKKSQEVLYNIERSLRHSEMIVGFTQTGSAANELKVIPYLYQVGENHAYFCSHNGLDFATHNVCTINERYDVRINSYCEAETLDNEELRRDRFKILSELTNSLFISCANGSGETTSECVYTSYKSICYKGKVLAETNEDVLVYDFDADLFGAKSKFVDQTPEKVEREPFIPTTLSEEGVCERIIDIQGKGLIQKMKSMNRDKIILGVSGGLDSTVALMSCIRAFDKYGLNRKKIIGLAMPGLGTTQRTYKNSKKLMELLGITMIEINLRPILRQTVKNLTLAEDDFGLTYQQTQSRERSQMLHDYANKVNGIVIGTGCMSEFALGWMTYGGDHLSMYAIAVGLPKTIIKHLGRYYAKTAKDDKLAKVLTDICDTPVSPELAPVTKEGEQKQKTEKLIGDYVLQDFFIYHMMVNNYGIKKIFDLACKAFPEFTKVDLVKYLDIFTLRFFTRAYKKNCFGDGIQILNYSLSPKSFWKMPSDISNYIWKKELEEIKEEIGYENL